MKLQFSKEKSKCRGAVSTLGVAQNEEQAAALTALDAIKLARARLLRNGFIWKEIAIMW